MTQAWRFSTTIQLLQMSVPFSVCFWAPAFWSCMTIHSPLQSLSVTRMATCEIYQPCITNHGHTCSYLQYIWTIYGQWAHVWWPSLLTYGIYVPSERAHRVGMMGNYVVIVLVMALASRDHRPPIVIPQKHGNIFPADELHENDH